MHLLLSVWLLAATPSGMAPLPAQYLQGKTFHSPDGWFTVATPAGEWEWFEMRAFDGEADPRWPDGVHGSVGWYVRDPKPGGEAFMVMETYSAFATMIDDNYIEHLPEDVRKSLTPDESISGFGAVRIGVPTEDSLYYWYTLKEKKSGATHYRFHYATGWQHKVFLIASSATPQEPAQLKRMVVSLRWLKSP